MDPKPTREELIEAAVGYVRDSGDLLSQQVDLLRSAIPDGGATLNIAGKILADAYEQEKQQREISDGLLEDWVREAEENRYEAPANGCYPMAGIFLLAAALLTGILIGHYWK